MKYRETTAGDRPVDTKKMTPRHLSPIRIAANKEWRAANATRIKANMSR